MAEPEQVSKEKFLQTLEQHPQRAELALKTAERCLALGRDAFALELLRSRERWNPETPELLARWARVAEGLGAWEEAEHLLHALLDREQTSFDAHFRLASLALERDRLDLFKDRLRAALAAGIPRSRWCPSSSRHEP